MNTIHRLLLSLLIATATASAAEIAIDPAHRDRWLLDGQSFRMTGIRTASASKDTATTDHLIAQLDDYLAHRVNAVSVTMMGSSAANYDPFNASGTAINSGHAGRIERIVQACDQRDMVVVLTIFYQFKAAGTPNLSSWTASKEAVRTTAAWIKAKGWKNVILNIANEQNSSAYSGLPWERVRNVVDLVEMVRLANTVHPALIVGAGGYDHAKNKQIGVSPDVDALLFDTSGPDKNSGQLYDEFRAAGVLGKPIANVEMFGGWTKQFTPPGVYPQSAKDEHYVDVDDAVTRPGLSVFFHSNPWCQGPSIGSYPIRFNLGGVGTSSDPGIRWWFTYVRDRMGGGTTPPPPSSGPSITGLILVDAGTDTVVGPLEEGMTIDLSRHPGGISVVAQGSGTASVRFDLDGQIGYRLENTAPYALFGDASGSDYHPWPSPAAGSHSVAATPFSQSKAAGTAGITVTRTFTLMQGDGNAPPVAKATATPTAGTAPLAVAFSAIGSTDSDGQIVSYHWAFGDGTTATGMNVSRTYIGDPGAYTATLTVTDDDGATDQASVVITVQEAATADLTINFQPASAPVPSGHLVDAGAAFAARGNGHTYGWNATNTSTRDRNSSRSPDQAHDTLIHCQLGGTFTWELALPAGWYEVELLAGDPDYLNSLHRLDVEGIRVIDGTPTSSLRWFTGTATVRVDDGRLTVRPGSGASNAKLNRIRVTAVPAGNG